MKLHTWMDRTAVRRRKSARKRIISLETLETRQLLSGLINPSAAGFLQGYVDNPSNNPLSGATVQLLNSAGTTVLWSETTNSAGYYNFNDYTGLTAGTTYNLVVSNSSTSSVGIQTTVDQASDNTSLPGYAHAIQVTVEPLSGSSPVSGLSPVNFQTTWTGAEALDYVNTQLIASSYNSAGAPFNSGNELEGQLGLTLTGNPGNTSSIGSACSDLLDGVYPNSPFTAYPSLTSDSTTISANVSDYTTNLGEIGYLYDKYATTPPSGQSFTSVNGAALQLALWALEYNQMPASGPMTLANPDTPFQVITTGTNATSSGIVSQANSYLSEAYNSTPEDAYFLTVHLPYELTAGQGMFSTDLLNFTAAPNSSVSTAIYDSGGGPVTDTLGEQVYDTATVTGAPSGPTPTGTVTYYFYNTASPVYGTTTPVSTQTVTLTSTGRCPIRHDGGADGRQLLVHRRLQRRQQLHGLRGRGRAADDQPGLLEREHGDL